MRSSRHGPWLTCLVGVVAMALLTQGVLGAEPGRRAEWNLTLDLKALPEASLAAGLSCKADGVSASVKSSTGGPLKLSLEAGSTRDLAWGKLSGSIKYSGEAPPDSKSLYHEASGKVAAKLGSGSSPWAIDGKSALALRIYPSNSLRNYIEASAGGTASRPLPFGNNTKLVIKLDAGHKEMPENPKWTADYWTSSCAIYWDPAQRVRVSSSMSWRGRRYPEALHKAYTVYSYELSAKWTPDKQHTITGGVLATAKLMPRNAQRDSADARASAGWTYKPSKPWTFDVDCAVTAGVQSKDPQAMSIGAAAQLGAVYEPSKVVKLSAGMGVTLGDASLSTGNAGDEGEAGDGDIDEREDGGVTSGAGHGSLSISMSLSGKYGIADGITVNAAFVLKNKGERAGDTYAFAGWAPRAQAGLSFKF